MKKRFPIGICLLICVFLLAGVIIALLLIGRTITGREEKKLIEEITNNARLFVPQKITVRKNEGAWHGEII